jgi:hypothetical protein
MSLYDKAILDEYYTSLTLVDQRYRELEAARIEEIWYESKLREADQLAVQYAVEKASSLCVHTSGLPPELSRDVVDLILTAAQENLVQYRKTQGELTASLEYFRKHIEATLKAIAQKIEKVSLKISILRKNLSSLEMSNIIYTVLVLGVGAATFYFTRGIIWTAIVPSIVALLVGAPHHTEQD